MISAFLGPIVSYKYWLLRDNIWLEVGRDDLYVVLTWKDILRFNISQQSLAKMKNYHYTEYYMICCYQETKKRTKRKYRMDCCLLQFHVKNDQTQMQHKWCISSRKTYHSIETHFEWHEIDTQRADQLMRLLPMAIFVWPWSNAVKKQAGVLYSQAWKKKLPIYIWDIAMESSIS